jgi:hypothetical protein
MSRVFQFLSRVSFTILFFCIAGLVCYLLQTYFHTFDGLISYVNQDIGKVKGTLSAELLTGISIGTIVLVIFILFFPLFMKGVQKKRYFVSVYRGVISSFVYFISDWVYQYTGRISRFYFLLSALIFIIITIVMVEILALSSKREKEAEVRTDMIAAVVSGLVFSLIIKFISSGWTYLKEIAMR